MVKINKIVVTVILIFFFNGICHADNNELRIPLHAASISLDPSKVQDSSSLWVSRQINCQLVRTNAGVLVMDAAESIRYISPLVIQVKLKSGIQFSNGKEVTSDDVQATFNYLKCKRTVLRNVFDWISEVSVSGKYTINIHIKKKVPQLLTVMAAPNYAIFDKNFIADAKKNPNLWKYPVGCGNYKMVENNSTSIKIIPTREGFPIRFYLIPDSEINANDMDHYDIIPLSIIGKSRQYLNFKAINIFDPYQYYFAINTRISPWNNLKNRCKLFSRLTPSIPMSAYGKKVRPADDFLPSGTIGYLGDTRISNLYSKYKSQQLPTKSKFCVVFISSAIEKYSRSKFLEMMRNIYPNTTSINISSYTNLPRDLDQNKCDGAFFAIKSNYLDAYEYFLTLLNNGANATGYKNRQLEDIIRDSQNIDNSKKRAEAYYLIAKKVNQLCLMYPLFTMPYDTAYVRINLITPGLGQGPINEYYLGNVNKIMKQP